MCEERAWRWGGGGGRYQGVSSGAQHPVYGVCGERAGGGGGEGDIGVRSASGARRPVRVMAAQLNDKGSNRVQARCHGALYQ